MPGGNEDEDLLQSVPTDDNSELMSTPAQDPYLESHDPQSGMGTIRFPDRSTVDVHLPTLGITPHPSIPVVSPSSSSSSTPQREDLSDLIARPGTGRPAVPPLLQRPPSYEPPASIAIPQAELDQVAAEHARRRTYREQTLPEWSRRQQAEREALDARHRAEDAEMSRRGREAASGYQDALAQDYEQEQHQAQEQEAREMADITAAPRMPLAPDRRQAETTVVPGSIGRTQNPDGSVVYTDAEGHELSREGQRFPSDGMVASHGSAMYAGTGPIAQPSEGTTINPDGSYTYTDDTGNQYSFNEDGTPQHFGQAAEQSPSDGILARPIPQDERESPFGSRRVPLAPQGQRQVERQRVIDRVEHRTTPEEELVSRSQEGGETVDTYAQQGVAPGPQYSEAPLYSDGGPILNPRFLDDQSSDVQSTQRPAYIGTPTGGRQTREIRRGDRTGSAPRLSQDEQFISDLTNRPRTQPGQTPPRQPLRDMTDQDLERLAGQPRQQEPDLIDRQFNVEAKRQELAGDQARMQLDIQQQAERQRQELEDERRRVMTSAQNRYQSAIDRVANAHIDPQRFFRDRGFAGQLGSVLAVALGGLGGVYTGTGRNLGLDEINRWVDRDIAAQQDDMQNIRGAADMQGNMIGIMRSEFSDRQAAQDAARAAMLQQVSLMVQQRQAGFNTAEAANNATQLRQQIDQQAEEARQAAIVRQSEVDLRTAQAQRFLAQGEHEMSLADYQSLRNRQLMYRMQHPGSGQHEPDRTNATMFEAYTRAMESQPNTPQARLAAARAIFPPGSYYFNNPPEHASVTGVERRQLETLNSALNQVERDLPTDIREDIPGYGMTGMFNHLLLSTQGQNLRQDMQNLRDAFARDRTGANMSAQESDTFDNILGMTNSSSDAELRHGLHIMRQIMADHLNRSADTLGLRDRDVSDIAPGARQISEEGDDTTSDPDMDSRVD